MAGEPRIVEGKEFRARWRSLDTLARRELWRIASRGESDASRERAAMIGSFARWKLRSYRRQRWWMWGLIVVDGGFTAWATLGAMDLPFFGDGWIGLAPLAFLAAVLLHSELRWMPRLRQALERSEAILHGASPEHR